MTSRFLQKFPVMNLFNIEDLGFPRAGSLNHNSLKYG